MRKKPMIDLTYALVSDAARISTVFKIVVSQAVVYNEAARASEINTYTPDYISRLIEADSKAVTLYKIDGIIAGFLITEFQDGPIWIEWIGVDPKYRKHNIAGAMVEFCMSEAPSRGGHKIWCDTRDENVAAVALFTQKSFQQKSRLDNHWHGQNYIIWEKFL